MQAIKEPELVYSQSYTEAEMSLYFSCFYFNAFKSCCLVLNSNGDCVHVYMIAVGVGSSSACGDGVIKLLSPTLFLKGCGFDKRRLR